VKKEREVWAAGVLHAFFRVYTLSSGVLVCRDGRVDSSVFMFFMSACVHVLWVNVLYSFLSFSLIPVRLTFVEQDRLDSNSSLLLSCSLFFDDL
jgi:hypothetical protein